MEGLEPRLLLSADTALMGGGLPDVDDLTHAPLDLETAFDSAPSAVVADDAMVASVQVRRELVFVDSRAPEPQQLLDDLRSAGDHERRFEVVVLDPEQDGIAQISQTLNGYRDLDAVHFVSHGTGSAVQLGETWLSIDNLDANRTAIAGWRDALAADADLLFYGCNLAAGEDGQALVAGLAELTGADVAASDDVTGSALLGGDWDLEYHAGDVETAIALSTELQQDWSGALANSPPTVALTNTITTFPEDTDTSSAIKVADIVVTDVDAATWWGDSDSGMVTHAGSGAAEANAIAVDSSGNTYVAGGDNGNLIVRKYDANGDLDLTWGDGDSGMVTFDGGNDDDARAVTLDASGNIYVAGLSNNGDDHDFIVRKYDANGDLDLSWGDGDSGMVTFDSGNLDVADAITIDASGNIYAAGWSNNGSDTDLIVRKYDANGDLTTDWGDADSGMVTFAGVSNDGANALILDASNNIYVAGYQGNGSNWDFSVWKYDANGDLTTDWGDGDSGVVTFNGSNRQDNARDITLDASGNIYVAGLSNNTADDDFIVRKYDASGDLDLSWGDGNSGMVTFDGDNKDEATGITLDASNNIYVAGLSNNGTNNELIVRKYDANGDLDTTWGDGDSGVVTFDGGNNDEAKDITLDASGNIYVAGSSNNGTNDDLIVRKYDADGNLAGDTNDLTLTGTDAAMFEIVGTELRLKAGAVLDFETNPDLDVTVEVDDTAVGATPDDTAPLSISITDVNEAPVITSNGGGPAAAINAAENQTAVTTVTWTDQDLPADSITYALSGDDAALFSIDASGVLTFVAAPDFETPTDFDADGVYDVTVTVDDNAGSTDTQDISVTVTDVNDAPVITSNGGGPTAAINAAENQTAVTTITWTDQDIPADSITYALSGDDAALFSIDASGVLTFVAAPDFETPTDFDADGVYDVTVTVDDNAGATDAQDISVTVTDANDAPVITSNGGGPTAAINAAENQTAVTTVTWTDQDIPADSITYALSGDDAALFSIDALGVLTFIAAPDFETPTDFDADGVYDVTVTVDDNAGATDTQDISVTVTDVDDAPVITSNGGGPTAAMNAAENQTAVTTVTWTDQDVPADSITYALSGDDAALFSIDASGVLTFVAAPDFETPIDFDGDGVYDVTVTVDDNAGATDTQDISVTVTDANDAPVITSNGGGPTAAINAAENQTAVTTVTWTDQDIPADSITYALSGDDAALFSIDALGVLTFIAAPDFETPTDLDADGVYDVTVTVDDNAGSTDSQDIAVTVTGVNEAVVLTSNGGGPTAAINAAENQTAVTTVAWTDPDVPADSITYALSGDDAALFSIDAFGVLTFVAAPDFETPTDFDADGVYDVTVTVDDNAGSTDTQDISVTVTDVNDAPVISSNGGGPTAAINAAENQTAVTTVTWTDQDIPADSITYALSGDDAALFSIDASGVLTFVAAPDFETPTDFDADGVYDVTVTVDDNAGSTDSQDISVTVTNVNEPPTISDLQDDSVVYIHGEGAQLIDKGAAATVADDDSVEFDTGNLTVSIVAGGAAAEDVLSIRDEGPGPGLIGFDGANVTYGGILIGTAAGGSGGADLIVTFNANATPEAVTALVGNITYGNTELTGPATGARTVRFAIDDGDGHTSIGYDTTVHVKLPTLVGSAWLSTTDTVAGSGAPGLDNWDDSEALSFGEPNLTFDAGTTDGAFSSVFDLGDFTGDTDIDAIHRVSRDMTVGTNNFQLFAGDVLVSTQNAVTLTSTNSLAVADQDVFVFRADTPGDYSSGTFLMLLDASDVGDPQITAFTLVEQTIVVGGVTLNAGDFLYSKNNSAIHQFTPGTLGDTTSGSEVVFIDGSDIGLNENIDAIDLIEEHITVGTTSLTAGQLLLSMNNDNASAGDNGIATDRQDVFILDVTTAGANTVADATLFFDGSDVNLDTAGEDVDAFSLKFDRDAPIIADLYGDQLTYYQGVGPQAIDQGTLATVSDLDSVDFDTGNLTVSIAAGGDAAEDVISIHDQGTGAGQIGFDGANVTYGGVLIGTAVGGSGGADLVVTFNADAAPAAVTALVRNITYENTDVAAPTTGARAVRFTIDDGEGNASPNYDVTIDVRLGTQVSGAWLSTKDAVPGSGAPGLDNWDDSEALSFGDPNLAFDPGTTSGTFASVFNLGDFTGDTDIDAIHHVSQDMTVGTNNFQLFAGDVLVSTRNAVTLTSTNSLSVDEEDIFVFRPDTPGDYSSGTFLMLLDASDVGDPQITAFTLVEQTIVVGGVTLNAGDFLYSKNWHDVYHFTPGTLGATTSGSESLFFDGDPIGLHDGGAIDAIELIEEDMWVGDTFLTAGQVLLSMENEDASTGDNGIATDRQDIFILDITTAGASTVADATLFLDGSDVNLDTDGEDVDALTFSTHYGAPVIFDLIGDTVTYLQGGSAVVIDQGTAASVSDTDSADFDTGSLTVSIAAGGDAAEDVLSIRDQGGGAGQIGISGSDVTYEGVTIGTVGGGSGGADLVVTFNSNATLEAATALVRNITYENTDAATPTLGARTVRFSIEDGDGKTSINYDTTVRVNLPIQAGAVWLSTKDAVTGSGAPGLDNWDDSEALSFGDPNLAFDPGTTDGTFSSVFDLGAFTGDTDIDAIHYVSRDMTLGANNFQLFAGDVLISTQNAVTLTSTNALAVDDRDVFVFRADTPGDYSSGTFLMLLDASDVGDPHITAFTLVEQTIVVGGVTLNAGDFLYSKNKHDVHQFTPGTLGDTTSGSEVLFIDGSDIDLDTPGHGDPKIDALELIENDISVGNTLLSAGQVLLSMDKADTATGDNGIATDRQDVFILDVTTAGANTVADATLFLDGSDVNLDTNGENIDAFSLLQDNQPPTVSLINTTTTFPEDRDTSSAIIVADIVVTDDTIGTNDLTVSGTDAAMFEIVGMQLRLKAGAVLDFETNPDLDVTVEVDDVTVGATPDDTAPLSISITDVNDAPIITSNGGGPTAAINAAENQTAVTTVTWTDQDVPADSITYALSGGDAALFSIDASGVLTFAAAPDFETPTDFDADGVYDVTVTVDDNAGSTDTQDIAVTVTDVNDAPVITSNGGGPTAAINAAENQTSVTTVTWTDQDIPADSITYSLSGDDAALFSIDASGVLTFVAAPDFETPTDFDADGVYDVTVTVDDNAGSTDTQDIAVTVTGVNEAVVITSNGGGPTAAINAAENQSAVTTVTWTDPDVPADSITYSLSGDDAALFSIDAFGVLTFIAAPDFESSTDFDADGVYDVTVTVDDNAGSTDSQDIAVTVTDVNDAPVITSNGGGPTAAINAAENQTAVTTVTWTDQDIPADSITYALSGDDAALFSIDASGVLTFIAAPDFETPTDFDADGVYDVTVTVDDNAGSTDTQDISVTVTDANDAPVITSNGGGPTAAINAAENQTAVTTVAWTDADVPADSITYALSGDDAALFSIDASGVLTFVAAPDFETPTDFDADGVYEVTVTVDDNAGATDTQDISVTVTDANDAPVITSNGGGPTAAINAAENQTAVTTVTWTDQDIPADSITYVLSGDDAALFSIDASGVLTFVAASDFETPTDFDADGVYEVTVTVDDNAGSTDTQDISVTVTDVNDAPVITSNGGGPTAAINAAENQTAVTTVTWTDADLPADSITYSLSGDDAALFSIDAFGVLTFIAAPDFETPTDFDADGVYDVTVTVDDNAGATDTQDISVTVTDANDAPVITSNGGGPTAAINAAENQTAVTTVTWTDADLPADSITYALSGDDAALFSIDASGVLTFAAAPDFETPTDFDADGVYDVTVTVDDNAGATDTQDISVTVTDVNDAPVITSNGGGPTAAINAGENQTAVTTVTWTDQDIPADSITYALSGDDAALFSIDASGVLTFAAAPDFETPTDFDADGVYDVTVTVDDNAGATDTQDISVTVTDANDVPTASDNTVTTAEDTAVAFTVADFGFSDVDAGDSLAQIQVISLETAGSLQLSGADVTLGQVISAADITAGNLTFTPAADANGVGYDSFDFRVHDGTDYSAASYTMTVDVTPVNDAPVASDATFALDENSANGTVVGTVVASDPDAGDTLSYAITAGDPGGAFAIDVATGEVAVADASRLDFEATPVFNLTVEVTDSGGFTDTAATALNLTDVNDAPAAAAAAFSLAENSANGTVVGTVSASDPDAGDTLSYAITGGDLGGAFAIDAVTGEITVADASQLDFEATPVFDLTVEVTDAGGLTDTEIVPISLEPVDELVVDGSEPPPPDEEVDPTDDSDDTGTEPTEDEGDTEAESTTETSTPVETGGLRLEESRWTPASSSSPEAGVLMSHESSERLAQENRRDPSRHGEYEAAHGRLAILRTQQMAQVLDQIREEMASDAELAAGEREIIVSSAEGVALAASAGLIGLLLRGGSLAAVALSALPVWRRVDPLAVLALSDEERKKREEELRAALETEDLGEEAVGRLLDQDEPRVG